MLSNLVIPKFIKKNAIIHFGNIKINPDITPTSVSVMLTHVINLISDVQRNILQKYYFCNTRSYICLRLHVISK